MDNKICSKCKIEPARSGQRYCKKCHAEHMRTTRPEYKSLSGEQKLKLNARRYLNVYVERGKVTRMPCVICGSTETEGHHKDYTNPLDVIWYCRLHHLEHHKK